MPVVHSTGVNKINVEGDQYSQYMTQDETILVSDPWLRLEKVMGFQLECTTFYITRAACFHDRTCQCDNILHVLHDCSEGWMPAIIQGR
jgi:hypothetical protein